MLTEHIMGLHMALDAGKKSITSDVSKPFIDLNSSLAITSSSEKNEGTLKY
jgi:hypothetical protein